MSYSETVDQAIHTIKQQTALMQRCLTQHKLMDSLRYASVMLTELRNPKLSPKQYYELYVMIFDSLTVLSSYLVDNHLSGHHLADLYELVQYAGNVVPRLYLMITVGTSYLKLPDSPKEEILKDMIEMCRGVQNPIRGLFLRYYLAQRTKQLLPEKAVSFNSQLIITNFIEMNKLWVRLQHQGPLRERDQRTKERKELQILVGSQLVQLSQIVDDDVKLYSDTILPVVLEQLIQCRDVVCQEYLYDVICQVFPDYFHYLTLDTLLNTLLQLNPEISMTKLLVPLTSRLEELRKRLSQEQQEKMSEGGQTNVREIQQDEKQKSVSPTTNNSSENLSHDTLDGDIDTVIISKFWKFLNELNAERPDLSLQEFLGIVENIVNLLLNWNPDNFEYLNRLFELTYQKCKDFSGDGVVIDSPDIALLLRNLMTFKVSPTLENDQNFLFEVIVNCRAYGKLLSLQCSNFQGDTIGEILNVFLREDVQKSAHRTESTPQKLFSPISKEQVERILVFLEPLIRLNDNGKSQAEVKSSESKGLSVGDTLLVDNTSFVNGKSLGGVQLCNIEQEKLAKFCHVLIRALSRSKELKTIEKQVEVILLIKSWLHKGGTNIKYTYPTIITNFWMLIKRASIFKLKIKLREKYYDNLIKQTFKYVSRCINEVYNICGQPCFDAVFKLSLQTASLADQLTYGEIAYDYFSEAFTIFEESLTDSKTQFVALIYLTQVLQRTRSLYKENYYNSLIVRATLHGSRLLRKQDQCRSVYLCSHLWWATEISFIGEEEGKTTDFFREGKRVLECLQRSLRAADSIMDNVQSCELMTEVLDRCLYYFVHGNEHETRVGVNYINGLIELIKTNLESLTLEKEQQQLADLHVQNEASMNEPAVRYVIGSDGEFIRLADKNNASSVDHTSGARDSPISTIQVPLQHFKRTCQYILDQRDVDDRFKAIII